MGRWTQYDEDSYRLPEGMVRVGYDADTQQYTFRDMTDGSRWTGAPGCRIWQNDQVSRTERMFSGYRPPLPEPRRSSSSAGIQTSNPWSAQQQSSEKDVKKNVKTHIKAPWKILAPFLLLIRRVLILAY